MGAKPRRIKEELAVAMRRWVEEEEQVTRHGGTEVSVPRPPSRCRECPDFAGDAGCGCWAGYPA